MIEVQWQLVLAIFLGGLPLVLPVIALLAWNLIEVKSGFAQIRAELLQIRSELSQIKTDISSIRERVAVLEERDRQHLVRP